LGKVPIVLDRDVHDDRAAHFPAILRGERRNPGVPLGSVRLVPGETRAGFRFPCEGSFRSELPEPFRRVPVEKRAEIGRLVASRRS
jgi:hypothetical protein